MTGSFVLRHKAEALVALGTGGSYRHAAWAARRLANRPSGRARTPAVSTDRRVTADWVEQYSAILGDALLLIRCSYSIAVDEWEVRTIRFRDDGTRVQRGRDAYFVLAVVGYRNSPTPADCGSSRAPG